MFALEKNAHREKDYNMLTITEFEQGLCIGDPIYIKEGRAERYKLLGRSLDEIYDFHVVVEINTDSIEVMDSQEIHDPYVYAHLILPIEGV